ncbi:MAG: DUF2231 domain-containing protein [Chitinophagaceae bacterium]|nr:MAG: DUF2231 domain-containing protein [Chitinophagaceae bacterium]
MRSKAHIKSHPLHPILIGFPLAFFIGSFVFDVLYLLSNNLSFRTTAYYLNIAGVIGGVLAAVPGIIDFIYTVPPESSAKKRAATHGLLNTTNLLLFVVVIILKKNETINYSVLVVMEAVGLAILFTAGWMGGTLVYRNQIGVDPRYAEAGKWKEEYHDEKAELAVAKADELKVNQMKLLHIGKRRIVIARSEKGYVAFDDRCTHRGGSLAGGAMICGTVQCPWHGSQFDVHNGQVTAGPAKEKIKTYTVEERSGVVYLTL